VLAVLDRYEAPLVRYAAGIVGDGDSAREAVQHAFLQLCEQTSEELRGREAPWLFRVCRNKALDLVRLRRRHAGDGEADLAALAGREPDPAEAAERQDLAGELGRMLAQLPQNQREAIQLWCEGFSYREIAKIAAQSEGNVRVLVHRGIKELRRCFGVTSEK
jgi:RNA polymerase sigma-70 factor (ECF subfamily)